MTLANKSAIFLYFYSFSAYYAYLGARFALFYVYIFLTAFFAVGEVNPPTWRKSEGITTCLSQKGIEFDPFELWVIQSLPHTKILNSVSITHPIAHNGIGILCIFVFYNGLMSQKISKKNEHGKSDRFFIAFCNSLIVSGASGVKLSRVFDVLVKRKTCIYVYSSLYVS